MSKQKLYCENCGSEVQEDDTFCRGCGLDFVETDNTEEKPAPEEPINHQKKTEITINRLILLGNIYKWILIIIAAICFILSFFANNAITLISNIIISLIIFSCSFFADVFANWLAYTLKNLCEINNKLNYSQRKNNK